MTLAKTSGAIVYTEGFSVHFARSRPLVQLVTVVLLLSGCQSQPVEVPPAVQSMSPPAGPAPGLTTPVDAPAPLPSPPVRARIAAVGDLLMHTPLVYSAALPSGEWDFKALFAPVRPWIEDADLAIANLETTLSCCCPPYG